MHLAAGSGRWSALQSDGPVLGLIEGAEFESVRGVMRPGDALVMGGASRLIFHGIDRLYPDGDLLAAADEPAFLPPGGRCNLTLRRVTVPASP